jgi:hypothetical protein
VAHSAPAFRLSGERRDGDARGLAGRLLRIALAVLHAPAYQADHCSALSADWAHLPMPRDTALFDRLAEAGELVARLLDANSDARDQVFSVMGEERAAHLARFRKTDGGPIGPEDLKVTVNYWGGAKGRWVPRPFTSEEDALPAWGERTGELYIADDVFFANVPESVWQYELGGYPVMKKWLGYARLTAVTTSRSPPTNAAGFDQSYSALPLCSPSVNASMSCTPPLPKAPLRRPNSASSGRPAPPVPKSNLAWMRKNDGTLQRTKEQTERDGKAVAGGWFDAELGEQDVELQLRDRERRRQDLKAHHALFEGLEQFDADNIGVALAA